MPARQLSCKLMSNRENSASISLLLSDFDPWTSGSHVCIMGFLCGSEMSDFENKYLLLVEQIIVFIFMGFVVNNQNTTRPDI